MSKASELLAVLDAAMLGQPSHERTFVDRNRLFEVRSEGAALWGTRSETVLTLGRNPSPGSLQMLEALCLLYQAWPEIRKLLIQKEKEDRLQEDQVLI